MVANDKNLLLRIKEGSAFTGFAESRLRYWIATNQIEYVKIGRSVFIKRDTLLRIIEESTVRPEGIAM